MNIDIDILKNDARKLVPFCFVKALRQLREMQLTIRPNIDRIVYIYEYLNQINETTKLYHIDDTSDQNQIEDENRSKYDADLIYLGLSSYNNVGDTDKAFELIKKFDAIKEKGCIPVSDYINITNRLAVTFYDAGDFNEAAERQWDNIEILEKMYETFKMISVETGLSIQSEDITKNLGRAYSGYGRFVYSIGRREMALNNDQNGMASKWSFSGKNEFESNSNIQLGIEYLEKALDIFAEDKGNRMITMTHILQIAAETGNRKLFEKYKDEYFGTGNPGWSGVTVEDFIAGKDSMDYSKIKDYDYGLLAIVKCINAFYIDYVKTIMATSESKEKKAFLEFIKRLINSLGERKSLAYPANLVLAHLGDLIYEINGNVVDEDVRYLYELATTSNDDFRIDTRSMTIETVISYQLMWNLYNKDARNDAINKSDFGKEEISGMQEKLLAQFIERAESAGTATEKYAEFALDNKGLDDMVYFV